MIFFLADQEEFWRRRAELKEFFEAHPDDGEERWEEKNYRLANLPETELWEGDIVELKRLNDQQGQPMLHMHTTEFRDGLCRTERLEIVKIDYEGILSKSSGDKRGYAVTVAGKYDLNAIKRQYSNPTPSLLENYEQDRWRGKTPEDNLKLIERGPVWKFYHNEPLSFSSLKDEARFMQRIGQYSEVRNPANRLYVWTLSEALEVIRTGYAHGINVKSGVLTDTKRTQVIRFWDEDLGHRVAAETLKGFGIES